MATDLAPSVGPSWKPSVFSVEVPHGTSTLLFNTSRRTFVQLTPNLHHILSNNRAAANKLASEGYLVSLGESVKSEYEAHFDAISRDRRHLNLLFTPNTTCNLACAYCFENRTRRSAMRPEVVDATLAWLRTRLIQRNIRELSLNLFGGEPMLEFDILIYFLKQCKTMLTECHSKYRTVQLTTNGLHGDRAQLEQLANLGVNEAQITFDGPSYINDARRRRRRRTLGVSAGVFDSIVQNLQMYGELFQLTIKINFDRTTAASIGAFLDQLGSKSNLAFGQYVVKPEPIAAWTNKSRSYNTQLFDRGTKELAEAFAQTLKEIDSRGIPLDLSAVFPTPCMISSQDSFLVEPSGELRSCISAFGMPEFYVGDVRGTLDVENDRRRFRVSQSWPQVDDCIGRECSFMPICDGGCRYESVVQGQELGFMFCGYEYYKTLVPVVTSLLHSRSYKIERYVA